ncbi:MAG: glycine cleavage system transcriptional repressor [Armatimonadota bacterium]
MKDYILTVMARDRVGIVRDVSTGLADIGGNLTHVSQTVMRGYFTLILSVEMPDERTHLEIRQAVERRGGVGEFEVNVRPYQEAAAFKASVSERFTLSLRGNNQEGIISRITTYLADRNINIDDFYAYAIDGKFVMLVQVSIPMGVDVEKIQYELAQVGTEFGLIVHLQHENIFRAISEISPVMDLQRKR